MQYAPQYAPQYAAQDQDRLAAGQAAQDQDRLAAGQAALEQDSLYIPPRYPRRVRKGVLGEGGSETGIECRDYVTRQTRGDPRSARDRSTSCWDLLWRAPSVRKCGVSGRKERTQMHNVVGMRILMGLSRTGSESNNQEIRLDI